MKKFIGGTHIQEILKGGASAFIIRIFGIGSFYVLTYLITNNFGAEIYGNYALFMTTTQMLAILTVFGIDTANLRYVSEFSSKAQWGSIKKLTYNSYLIIFILSFFLFLLFLIFQATIREQLDVSTFYVFSLGIIVIPFSFGKFQNQCFRGRNKIFQFAIFEYLSIPLLSLFFLGTFLFLLPDFVTNEADTPILAYILGISCTVFLSFCIWNYKVFIKSRLYPTISSQYVFDNFIAVLKKGFPFVLASSSVFFITWYLQLIIKLTQGGADLGIYDVAFRIGLIVSLPLTAINASVAPKLSELFSTNQLEGLEEVVQKTILLTFSSSFVISLIIFIFSAPFLSFFGEEFTQGTSILRLLIIAHFINAASGPVGFVLMMTEHQHLYRNIVMFACLISVILGSILVPLFGLKGAACTYIFFMMCSAYLLIKEVKKQLKIWVLPSLPIN